MARRARWLFRGKKPVRAATSGASGHLGLRRSNSMGQLAGQEAEPDSSAPAHQRLQHFRRSFVGTDTSGRSSRRNSRTETSSAFCLPPPSSPKPIRTNHLPHLRAASVTSHPFSHMSMPDVCLLRARSTTGASPQPCSLDDAHLSDQPSFAELPQSPPDANDPPTILLTMVENRPHESWLGSKAKQLFKSKCSTPARHQPAKSEFGGGRERVSLRSHSVDAATMRQAVLQAKAQHLGCGVVEVGPYHQHLRGVHRSLMVPNEVCACAGSCCAHKQKGAWLMHCCTWMPWPLYCSCAWLLLIVWAAN